MSWIGSIRCGFNSALYIQVKRIRSVYSPTWAGFRFCQPRPVAIRAKMPDSIITEDDAVLEIFLSSSSVHQLHSQFHCSSQQWHLLRQSIVLEILFCLLPTSSFANFLQQTLLSNLSALTPPQTTLALKLISALNTTRRANPPFSAIKSTIIRMRRTITL